MNLEQIVALLGKSERNEAVQKMLSHYGIEQPLARPKQGGNPVTPIELKDSHGITFVFGMAEIQVYYTEAYLEDELIFINLFVFPTDQAVVNCHELPAGVKVRSNLERQIEDLGEPVWKAEAAGTYMWHCGKFNVAFNYNDSGNKINWILYTIHPPLINEVIAFINGYEHGTFGWFDLCEIEQIPKEWDPDNAARLQEAGYSFLPLPDGSMVALLKTGNDCPDAVVYIGSEGDAWTIANSLEAFLMLWSKGETGIDDLDDEECAEGHEKLAEWLEWRQIKAPAAADFDFQAWLDEKPEAKPATVAPVKQEPAKVMDSPEKGGLLKTIKKLVTGRGSKPKKNEPPQKNEPVSGDEIVSLFGKPANDPEVVQFLQERLKVGIMDDTQPHYEPDNRRYYGLAKFVDKGIELVFGDSEYHEGADEEFWGTGIFSLYGAHFFAKFSTSEAVGGGGAYQFNVGFSNYRNVEFDWNNVKFFAGALPLGLDFKDSRDETRKKMARYESTRHSCIFSDTWDTEHYRVNVVYTQDDNFTVDDRSIRRMSCYQKTAPLAKRATMVFPAWQQINDAFGADAQNPLFTSLWPEDLNQNIQDLLAEYEGDTGLYWSNYGMELNFMDLRGKHAEISRPFVGITLLRNRAENSNHRGWDGELPFSLNFEDSPETLFTKIKEKPSTEPFMWGFDEDDYAKWNFPDYSMTVWFSSIENRLDKIEFEMLPEKREAMCPTEPKAVEDETLYRVKFPNPFGYALPKESEVRKLQKRYGFSDGYAEFLIKHNGLDSYACKDFGQEEFFVPDASRDAEDIGEDIRYLFSVNSGNEYSDLKGNLKDWKMLRPYFFPIGDDAGGNVFVEVLVGPLKGSIGNLNHDLFYDVDSLAELLEEEEDVGLKDMTEEQIIELLTSEDLDLFWLHAPSMEVFVRDCIFAKGNSFGVIDYEQPDEGEAEPSGGKSQAKPATSAPAKKQAMSLDEIVSLLGKSARDEGVRKMLSHFKIKKPRNFDVKFPQRVEFYFECEDNQLYCPDAQEGEPIFHSLCCVPDWQDWATWPAGFELPAGVKVPSTPEEQIKDLGEPLWKDEAKGTYLWYFGRYVVVFRYRYWSDNKINAITYSPIAPLIDRLVTFINDWGNGCGTFGQLNTCAIEQIPKKWNPDYAARLQAAGRSFLLFFDGARVALLKTGSGADAVVYLGSEGKGRTIANSLEAFLILWSKGKTGIVELDDEKYADGHKKLVGWLTARKIEAPAAADFDFQAWLDEKPATNPATDAPEKQD